MSANPKVIEFKLPKRPPKIIEKDPPPDQRKIVMVPLRAARDRRITDSQFRALTVLCSYANKAGITWVGQERIGQDLGVSKQSINKQLKKLVEFGYIEVIAKGFRGARANTIRVIYDESIGTQDAIAITSTAAEDTRPPAQREKELREIMADNDRELTPAEIQANLARLKALLGGVATEMTNTKREFKMPADQQTDTVKEIKKRVNKRRHSQLNRVDNEVIGQPSHSQPNRVDHEHAHSQPNTVDAKSLHSQLHCQPNGVDRTHENIGIDKVLDIYKNIRLTMFGQPEVRLTETDMAAVTMTCEIGVTESEFRSTLVGLTEQTSLADACRAVLRAKGL